MVKPKHKRSQPAVKDPDRNCVLCGAAYIAVSPLQKTCSAECRKKHYKTLQTDFKLRHPDKQTEYNKNRKEKDPDVWRKKNRSERLEIIKALGGKCCVPECTASNPFHFHFDYIPTMQGTGLRHPRHKAWVIENLKDFRLICANHHYELTITGKIQGTEITQTTKCRIKN